MINESYPASLGASTSDHDILLQHIAISASEALIPGRPCGFWGVFSARTGRAGPSGAAGHGRRARIVRPVFGAENRADGVRTGA